MFMDPFHLNEVAADVVHGGIRAIASALFLKLLTGRSAARRRGRHTACTCGADDRSDDPGGRP